MSESVNGTLEKIEEVFKDLAWDNLTEVGITALFAATHIDKIPVLSDVIRYILRTFSGILYKGFKLMIDIAAVRFINYAHQKAFERAEIELNLIARQWGYGSPQYEEARLKERVAFAKFIGYGGVNEEAYRLVAYSPNTLARMRNGGGPGNDRLHC